LSVATSQIHPRHLAWNSKGPNAQLPDLKAICGLSRMIAVGFSTRPAQGSARHQFPFRGSTIPGRSLPRTGVAFF
jgi:hypothetical protein